MPLLGAALRGAPAR